MAASTKELGMPVPTMAKRLWVECRREWIFALHTPFVISLASGNLELDTFHNFVSQQLHFLKCYAQALEKAEACADDDAKMSFGLLMEDLKHHDSAFKIWGFDRTQEYPANPATVKYTDFLLETASGKVDGVKLATPFEKTRVAVYTLGAILPHIHLYGFIGQELLSLPGAKGSSTHPYKNWIDCYSSEHFKVSVVLAEDFLSKLTVSLTGEELDNIQKLYHHAMKLELDFFSAQPMVQKTVVPLLKEYTPSEYHLMIFCDFDLTCTVTGSSATLAKIAIEKAPESDQVQSENEIAQMTPAGLRNTWELLSKEYKEEYDQCISNIMIAEYDRCLESILFSEKCTIVETKEQERNIANKIFSGEVEKFNYTVLQKALWPLSKFKKRANKRVIESGLLKGLNLEDVKRAGERLILQDGCISFFQSITKNENINASIHVLSYCWCNDLIKSAFSSGDLRNLDINANELMYKESITTGEIIRKFQSPFDKAGCFGDIPRKSGSNKRKKLTVYIGDSVGDLLCLVDADIGIVIGSNENLKKMATRFDISIIPLFDGLVQKQKQKETVQGKQSGTLFTVSNWAEIHAFILGSDESFLVQM